MAIPRCHSGVGLLLREIDAVNTEIKFAANDILLLGDRVVIIDNGSENYIKYKNDDHVLYMQKGISQVNSYVDLVKQLETDCHKIDKCLEIGVFRGGSAVFLHEIFGLSQLVCVEKSEKPVPLLEAFAATRPGVRTFYGVDQADATRLRQIITEQFPDGLDLVVDDASHLYQPSRISFETAFPFLRPGGLYLLEDWPWAHQPDAQQPDHYRASHDAMTNLIFELTIVFAVNFRVVRRIVHTLGFTLVERGDQDLPRDGGFRLDDYLRTRGRPLVKI